MAKNIVVLSDGTGQDGGKGPDTNVYKLFRMLENRTERQIVFYDRGLGTGNWRLLGGATGLGISKNIIECYEFIFNNFNADDRIYLFGFSRGATTVRSLSGFIQLFGILPKSRPELIRQAYRIYRKSDETRRKAAAEDFVGRHHNMGAKIRFLGVWDTVAALGVPFKSLDVVIDKFWFLKHSFHNLKLSESVENACHALAIDDERLTFHPQLWEPAIEKGQTMKQVWFCGMHSDVGGGYAEQGLSDVALRWMVDNATGHGLDIYPRHRVEIKPDAAGKMHDSRGTRLTRLYRRKRRSWPAETHGNPRVHDSVVARKSLGEEGKTGPYAPWILDGSYTVEIERDEPAKPPARTGGRARRRSADKAGEKA